MSGGTPQRYLVVVNPAARGAAGLAGSLADACRSQGLDADVTITRDTEHLDAVVRGAIAAGVDGFVAVGGDGTLHHLANSLPIDDDRRRFALAMLPAGTGSDFARTFGQRGDVDALVHRLASGECYPIDVGWVRGSFGSRLFVNAANAGIAARSVITAERLTRRIGPLRYTAAFWLTLPRFRSAPIDVSVDHHRFTGEALNIVVANGQFFGGGLNVAPRATLVDGLFDVLVFSGARSSAFTVMPRLAIGSHLTHRAVHRYVGASVRIDVPETWPIEADGELLGRGPVDVGVRPNALDYLV